MPAHSINQPFEVHVEDAHPQVKVGRRNRGRSMLMTTMEFRTATTSGMQIRAENASGVRISITGPKPGDGSDEEEGPTFEGTAVSRPVYNTRTAISVTHRDVNLALLKRTNPVRFVTVAPIPEEEVPSLPPIPENTVITTAVYQEHVTLEDIPPRPSCPEPVDDEDEDDFPLKRRMTPDVLVLADLSTNLPQVSASLSSPPISRSSFDSYEDLESSECSLALSQSESIISQSSGPLNGLRKSVKRKLVSSSTASLAASGSAKGLVSKSRSVKGLFSSISITKSKRRAAKETEIMNEMGEASEVMTGVAGKGTKRSREDEENLPAVMEQDSKEGREIKGRRIKRKLAAF